MNKSFKAITEAYTEYLQTLGFAASTVYDFPRFIADFLKWLEQKGINQVNQISTKLVFDYFAYLERARGKRTKQTFSTAHLKRIFLAVDKFLEFLHFNGLDNAPPPTRYTIAHCRKKPIQVLTPQEIQTLYNALPYTFPDLTFATREPRQMAAKLALDLCYGCGLRRTEALNLKLNDINFEQKIIHVKQGKNYKDRIIPMSRKIYENLQTFIYQYRRCFTKRPEYLYPFGSGALAEALDFLVKNCNDEKIKSKKPSLHTLRHSIATHLLQNGMNIENIARFLGHSTLESTKIYTHILNEL